MNKKLLLIPLALILALSLVAIGCPAAPPEKDEIIFGGARPLSGPLNFFEQFGAGPVNQMWIDDVNAKGGIYVEDYGKRLPITTEGYLYDDKSDMGTMTRLLEKLMVEDKVDFVFSPCSTAFLYAAAPIFNKHGYILTGGEGGATSITGLLPTLPYVFMPLNYSDHYQVPALVEIFKDVGVKTVAIIFIADLHGVEYTGVATPALAMAGIEVKMNKSVPPGTPDVSPLLKEAEALGVDAFLSFTYPPETMLVPGQAIGLGINFNAFLLGPGGGYNVVKEGFGPAFEGVMTWGAWNGKSSPSAAEFEAAMIERFGPIVMDYWGQIIFYAALQHMEQAIEEAGTLDHAVIRDFMATKTYETVMGPFWYDMTAGGAGGGLLAEDVYLGQIGQWQSGYHEVIDVGENRTASPIYPKPDWPTAPPPE